eukprot:CAMPEP_0113851642 /NCGR_PEP_ID=MMETSP0372-20130328/4802_1 /TAXON_ID=340204 /ORGANISM="Lankesteria abbotti" /LENGTH=88 /DNA_ID=CAMNT_0000822571 /DNA_START=62 /DNA_END=328 /DNA_ORIENTATION=+ /assembly_acc=CAM_ASM_000359
MALSPANVMNLNELYGQVMAAAGGFANRNFRQYFVRRANDDFRRCLDSKPSPPEYQDFMKNMKEHLAMLNRQKEIGNMYRLEQVLAKR